MVGTGLADTEELLNEDNGVEIGRWWDFNTGLPDFQLTVQTKEGFESVENNIYLYRVVEPYVYLVNKNNRYTVYDYVNCITICQTDELGDLDKIHRIVFEDKSRFKDIIYPYMTGETMVYPRIELSNGVIYLQYNSRLEEYSLRSSIFDEAIDFIPNERMTEGLPVNNIRKYRVMEPYVLVLDCNGKRTVVNYETYECIYSDYMNKGAATVDLSAFNDISTFTSVEVAFKTPH